MKKICILSVITIAVIFGTVLFTQAEPITLNYLTNTGDEGPGSGFLYTLTYDSTGSNSYSATFTVTTPGGEFTQNWWAGWFTFKFVEGDNAAQLILTGFPEGSGPWTAIPPPVSIYGGTNIGQGGRSGFYVNSLFGNDGSGAGFDYDKLIFLTTSGLTTYTFTFTLTTDLTVFTNEIPFQVGYYDGATGGGKVITNRLSQAVSVPEPSTILLLGAGLIGFGILGRKFRAKSSM